MIIDFFSIVQNMKHLCSKPGESDSILLLSHANCLRYQFFRFRHIISHIVHRQYTAQQHPLRSIRSRHMTSPKQLHSPPICLFYIKGILPRLFFLSQNFRDSLSYNFMIIFICSFHFIFSSPYSIKLYGLTEFLIF